MNNRKIIFILGNTELGGAENQAILLANEFIRKKYYEVNFILFGKGKGKASNKLENCNIKFYTISTPTSRFLLLKYLRLLNFFLLLRRLNPYILMPYTYFPNFYTSLVWRFTQARKCFWNQRDEGLDQIEDKLFLKVVSKASGFIANSNNIKNYLYKNLNVPLHKIGVIHNGYVKMETLKDRGFWRKQYSYSLNDFLICMVANLSKYKDHETLLKAFHLVLLKTDKPVKLLLAGRFDNNYEYLVHLTSELNISEKVFFFGKVDDMGSLLNSIDLSVLSSRSEGLPNVVIESMFSGVPVTGSKIEGIIEVLGEDYAEYLAEPGNSKELADKILFFLENGNIREKLSVQNLNRARAMFSVDNLYYKTINFIEQL